MAYNDPAVLAPLAVDVGTIKEYEARDSIEQKEMSNWLDKHLLAPIDAAGFAKTQEDYEAAYDSVFQTLEELNDTLGSRKYLTGGRLTAADVCLYSILVRFDSIFYFAYRLNRHKIKDYKNLFHYAKKLYHTEAFRKVTDFEKIKRSYYEAQTERENPYHIIMLGPDMREWQ